MSWYAENDRYLAAALDRVRARLLPEPPPSPPSTPSTPSEAAPTLEAREVDGYLPALAELAQSFGLSAFERDVLVLAAGPDLDAGFKAAPTVGLALAQLPEPHWNAFSPQAPLRYWRLLDWRPGESLLATSLRAEERVLHYLRGLEALDERLSGLAEILPRASVLVPSHRLLAERLAQSWSRVSGEVLPVAELAGPEPEGKREIAAAAAAALGLAVLALPASLLPSAPADLDGLVRLLGREAAFLRAALFIDAHDLDPANPADLARDAALSHLAERFRGPLVVATRERRRPRRRPVLPLAVAKPLPAEQGDLWRAALGPAAASLNGRVESLTAQFDLSAAAIRSAAAEVLSASAPEEEAPEPDALAAALWQACRGHARPRLESLAQPIRPAATWDDLVLPEPQRQALREMAIHVRRRSRVYEEWGFASLSSRGLGVSALFSGASGTGKTMAAEVLAGELSLDLFRIDLSAVVSKYIGETEKNLRQVFDAAEEGGAILLFDEADALFGKRSEVKDSHDRHANIEVGYLLQRMEAYRGLAILTTNMKSALDPAFLRRLRFLVQFPFPEAAQREEIWRRAFPRATPTEGLDYPALARLGVAGGNIRNIALAAAFLAADAGEPVRMRHALKAARSEYAKIEKPLTQVEIGGFEP